MQDTPHDDAVSLLLAWAGERDDVRAMLLTSTRARPDAVLDRWSDHDVILVVRDIAPYVEDRSWIDAFGEVLVAWWDPVGVNDLFGLPSFGGVVQYTGNRKIDPGVWPVAALERLAARQTLPAELDAGYRVLLDRDRLAATLPPSTFRAYRPVPPDTDRWDDTITGFLIGVPYVAKCLLRDELLPARWCLDADMRDTYLRPMLDWWMGCETGWSEPVGALGKGLTRRLPETWRADLEATWTGGSVVETWEGLFRLVTFFGAVAREVAAGTGHDYPDGLERRVVEHARWMRSTG